jgi:pantoate--beta-alanine ligase
VVKSGLNFAIGIDTKDALPAHKSTQIRSAPPPMLHKVRDIDPIRQTVASWQSQGFKVAFVPTMGALHQGHLDLIAAARARADKVVASIFVNPAQFAPHEDLARYPRDEARDAELLTQVGCDLLYAPSVETMYPSGFATKVSVDGVSARWEGAFRPHFFAGVATIVTKLFLQVRPDMALFGEKDWQQLQVVTQMTRDLDLDIDIIGVPTRRESDGLAMSSRNAYLSAEERAIAPALMQTLDRIFQALIHEKKQVAATVSDAQADLLAKGFTAIDYLAPCHAQTLEPWQDGDPLRVLGAAWLGKTRLIDNLGAP